MEEEQLKIIESLFTNRCLKTQNTYQKASDIARVEHVPVIVHVKELTQPIGHSSSGSHERYKSKERLEWEKLNDCNVKMRQWIIDNSISNEEELIEIELKCKHNVQISKKEAWETYINPILEEMKFIHGYSKLYFFSGHQLQLLSQVCSVDGSVHIFVC